MRINYGGGLYDEEEFSNLKEAIEDQVYTHSKFCNRFEKSFSTFLGVKHSIFVNSGSSANLLAACALINPGDEVITVAACFPTTVAPIVQRGGIPVFIDIDNTYNANPDYLKKALSRRTKGVMLAHTMGNPFEVNAVQDFCKKYGLWLIEDNCDALGSIYNKQRTGTFGTIATHSFYPAHHISTAEGGMVCTNDDDLAKKITSYRDWGRACHCPPGKDNVCGKRFAGEYDHKYTYDYLGYNLKATEFQGALGCAQMDKLPKIIEQRRTNWIFLASRTRNLTIQKPQLLAIPSWFGFLFAQDKLQHLEIHGVQARRLFTGNICKHPAMKGIKYKAIGDLPETDRAMQATWVGVSPKLQDKDLQYMVEILNKQEI